MQWPNNFPADNNIISPDSGGNFALKGNHDAAIESDYGAAEEPFRTSLHIAAEGGHDSMVDMLLTSGHIAIDESDSDANTALHVAVAGQKLVVALLLLRYGANPNAENAEGWTPVHLAVQTGSLEIVEALVAHGGDLGKKARGST
ncbi:Uncharacterized protein TCAP_04488 [Tolypocladium capitatum]|uniref:Uncharacterized protein n=1 Tax=Tolypocladium capitatum TaxID=45235 RepID=A0A2K3QDH8_9HYPO|nr:Uncharacterized protein TCAP_04488 [Tolypocladium capitatum]